MNDIGTQIFLGVVTGVATAAVLGLIAWVWRFWREFRIKQLGDLMGKMIEHRNAGLQAGSDSALWVRQAEELEKEAERKAKNVSASSGALIQWPGEDEPNVQDSKQQHIDKLTAMISMMQDTLARHDR